MGTGFISGVAMIVGLVWIILEACKWDVQTEKTRVKMREQWRQEARDGRQSKRK